MQHVLRDRLTIPLPLSDVFAFFADASNLERITPPQLKFHIISPEPIVLRQGALIDYELRLMGFRFQWQTRIAVWNPPHEFVDEQLRGPYKQWTHRHRFSFADGVTTIEDDVHWRLVFSPLGELAYPWVRWQLSRIFAYRRQAVASLLLAEKAGAAS